MQAYLARRLLALVPALFFASVIVFVIVRLVPGSIIDMMLAQNDVGADKLSRDQLISTLGLDRPMWQQYFTWISGILLHGDFGRSLWQNTPVGEQLLARLPITFELGLMALFFGQPAHSINKFQRFAKILELINLSQVVIVNGNPALQFSQQTLN